MPKSTQIALRQPRSRRPVEEGLEQPDEGFDRTEGDHADRDRLDDQRDVFGPIAERLFHRARLLRRPDDAAEAEMAGRGVDRLRHARRGTIAPAVVRRAEIRSALGHAPRDRTSGRHGSKLFSSAPPRGIVDRAAGALDRPGGSDTSRSSTPRHCRPCRRDHSRSPETHRRAMCPRTRRCRDSDREIRPARCSRGERRRA